LLLGIGAGAHGFHGHAAGEGFGGKFFVEGFLEGVEFFEIVLGGDGVAVTGAEGGGAGGSAEFVVGEFGGGEEGGDVAVAFGAEEAEFFFVGGELDAAGAELGHHLVVVLHDAEKGGAFLGREKIERGAVGAAEAEVVAEGGDEGVCELATGGEFFFAVASGGGVCAPPAGVGAGRGGAGGLEALLVAGEGAADGGVAGFGGGGRGGGGSGGVAGGSGAGGIGGCGGGAGRGGGGVGGAGGDEGDEREVGDERGGEEEGGGLHAAKSAVAGAWWWERG
jgi:hypothetical protein